MINIIVNYDENRVEVEGQPHFTVVSMESIGTLIKVILDKAYYLDEKLSLQIKRDNKYTELDRWVWD